MNITLKITRFRLNENGITSVSVGVCDCVRVCMCVCMCVQVKRGWDNKHRFFRSGKHFQDPKALAVAKIRKRKGRVQPLQHTATHSNTRQHTAMSRSVLQFYQI